MWSTYSIPNCTSNPASISPFENPPQPENKSIVFNGIINKTKETLLS